MRRSRRGWTWLSGIDTLLGEEREAYRLEIIGNGFRRAVEVVAPQHLYAAADQAADGAVGAVEIQVMQIGTHGLPRPTAITIHI